MKSTLFGLVAMLSFSAPVMAADWGGTELKASIDYAMDSFKDSSKSNFLTVISAEGVIRPQKNAASIVITYVDGKDTKSKKYFCHTHDTEIDCH